MYETKNLTRAEKIHHKFNALHIYCRLHPKVGKRKARMIARLWESTTVYRLLYMRREK